MKLKMLLIAVIMLCAAAGAQRAQAEEVLTWEECVAYTITNNPELRSSQELIRQSRAGVGLAVSEYLPQISASVGLSAGRRESESDLERLKVNTMTSSSEIRSAYQNDLLNRKSTTMDRSLSYGVSGKQLVFDSMKSVYDIKAASSRVDEARYEHAKTSSQIRLDLRKAFVELLRAQDSIQISREIAERSKKNLELVRMRYRAGREHRGSLLNAEANLSSARLGVAQAERDLTVARRGLLKQMGIGALRPIQAEGKLAYADTDREKPDFEAIAAGHPTVLLLKSQGKTAQYDEKSKIAEFFPVISITAGADSSLSYTDSRTSITKTNGVNLNAGIQATMPIFTGGKNYFNLDRAKSQTRKLKADEISARQQVVLALEQYWSSWQNACDRVEVQRKYLEAAEERARISEAQYSLGLLIFDNWIIIEDSLSQTKKSYLEALANQSIMEAQWLQAKGETLSYDK
ncbi:MAG: TolC family protein [Spirochaetes bacterium]|nr:TolC family protein [Spirochaetota bacterium]